MKITNVGTTRKPNYSLDASFGYNADGSRNRIVKRGFKTRSDAIEYYNKLAYLYSNNEVNISNKRLKYIDYLESWYNTKKVKLSLNAKLSYENRINNHIKPYFKNIYITKIDARTLQNFYNDLLDKLSIASANKVINVVELSLRSARENGIINKVPVIEKNKNIKTTKAVCSKEQLDIILKYLKDNSKYYLASLIASTTGMRLAEICGLKWECIDLINRVITVKAQAIYDNKSHLTIYTEKLKTDTSYRVISIPDTLVNELMQIEDRTSYVIKNKYGMITNPKSVSTSFTHTIRSLNKIDNTIPLITFHSLRHIHATLLLQNNVNMKVVSNRLGHSDITTTLNIYTHILKDMDQQATEQINNIF